MCQWTDGSRRASGESSDESFLVFLVFSTVYEVGTKYLPTHIDGACVLRALEKERRTVGRAEMSVIEEPPEVIGDQEARQGCQSAWPCEADKQLGQMLFGKEGYSKVPW